MTSIRCWHCKRILMTSVTPLPVPNADGEIPADTQTKSTAYCAHCQVRYSLTVEKV